MIVPFVFTMEVASPYDHIMPFYMYLNMTKKYGWPIIAHERYFQSLDTMCKEGFDDAWFAFIKETYTVDKPTQQELDCIPQYKIPDSFESELIARYPSQMDAWIHLLREDDPKFEEIIETMLDDIAANYLEPIEAVVGFFAPKSLKTVLEKRGIVFFGQEGGPIRPPAYKIFLAYLDSKGMYDYGELEERYTRFLEEKRETNAPLFSRKGLIKLFLSKKYLHDLHMMDQKPQYEVGLLQLSMQYGLHYQYTYMGNEEMRLRVQRKYSATAMLERARPGTNATSKDNSPTSFHFICKCKRVLGIMSNGLFEAMLIGRVSCGYGNHSYTFMENKGIEDDREEIVPLEFVNYVIFGYCIPWEWLTDVEYLRFRLSNPSEIDIYMKTFQYLTRDMDKERYERFYTIHGYEYSLGTEIHFTQEEDYTAFLYFKQGLSVAEKTFTWSDGDETSAMFDIIDTLDKDLVITIQTAMIHSSDMERQEVAFYGNDLLLEKVEIRQGRQETQVIVPKEICKEGRLCVRLAYSDPTLTPDKSRKIAIAFEKISINES